jgi:hypothetical protein
MRRIQKAPNPCNCEGNKIRSFAGAQNCPGGGFRVKHGKPRSAAYRTHGEAGPGPSYGDAKEGGDGYEGFDNDFTRRNTTFMTWNLMHMARMLKDAGGIPAWGNSVDLWQEGRCFDAPNPEYR